MAPLRPLATMILALALGACAGPREYVSSGVSSAATAVGAGPKPARTKDFVLQSRPERTEYQPVGRTPPARSVATPTAAQVAATEAAIDARRTVNQSAGETSAAAGEQAKNNAPKPPAR